MSKATLIKVPSVKSGDDEQLAEQFVELFTDATNGMRRILAFGIFAWQIKLLQLKHGQFGPWVKARCESKGVSYRSVRSYMQLTQSSLEACGVKLKPALAKWQTLPISHCGEFLLLPEGKVPESVKPIREKLTALVNGKSARQLFLEFKQSEDDGDEDVKPTPKRGRLKGQGGATKEQRAAAQAAQEQAEIDAMEIEAQDLCKWIDDVCDAKHLPRISDKVWDKLHARADQLVAFMRTVENGRKGAK